ncbi:LytR C-terminal domain-containing protein [Frigoribacterium sp. VKM Ac-2530]|uniref:LytR C-terminal domain-containing protein n=1 Tax=Frigoribacterium sp. VKM Ac-2530 TaxID=2783822 RepID=UPI00188B7BE1|nr:LytR C-terminal domain-containing protein [Frigoribacterium sp. VKM Ac-2530]MBF4580214.1 LytR C-terminal domain-containing protein [Frigoribacterium sp. VKM Ac-2530]
MAKHPRDRFDEVPDDLHRVGAHRAVARRGRGWVVFAWCALAVGVLVGAGVVYLGVANDSFQFVSPTSDETAEAGSGTPADDATDGTAAPTTPAETVAPADPASVDPDVTTITVLNGTTTSGLASRASLALAETGWTVAGQGNADGTVPSTIVYYADAADEAVARGVARDLGATTVELSDAFPDSSVTAVLGADYAS